MCVGRTEHHLHRPLRVRHREEVQCIAVLGGSQLSLNHIDVAFVYGNHVGHLHYASLNALKLVARIGKLQQ